MSDISVSYKISPASKLRLGYRVAGSGQPFTYLSRYLSYFESPYTIQGLPCCVSYELELTTVSQGCNGGPCGTPVYQVALYQGTTTLNAALYISVDKFTGNLNVVAQFSETVTSPITVTGTYMIRDTSISGSAHSENYSFTIPTNTTVFNTTLKKVTLTSVIDSYCTSSITPNISSGKVIVFVNTSPC